MGWKFLPVAKRLGIPLVVSFYGYDYDFLPNTKPIWRRRYRRLFRSSCIFLAEGEYGKKRLEEKGIPAQNIRVHHLGVDVNSIPFKARKRLKGEPLRVIQVAAFVEKKGHRTLIEAMRLLKENGDIEKIRVTLVGDGRLREEILGCADEYSVKEYIKLIDYIPYEDLHSLLLDHHLFVHPSVKTKNGDCEGGAPVVLLDAQATGMPVVSTFHCDIPEEVLHNKTGILVAEGDTEALAHTLLQFYTDSNLLSLYGIEARKHVQKNYSARIQTERLTCFYEEIIDTRRQTI